MAMIDVRNLQRNYGDFIALRDVSFQIRPGEIVGLLGPNGAGKSTTMKVLTGFLAPTSGEVLVAGHNVLEDPTQVRRSLGYLPENAPVYGNMEVYAYLDFIARIRGLGPAERARAIDRVATECGLNDRLGQRIGTLSRGFRQRVGLAQALVHEPRVLILDEPTTGLDPNQIVEIRELIRRVGATRTVILSTHILPEVQVTCDRILVMHRGRLVADERTDRVVASTRGQVITIGIATGKVRVSEDALRAELLELPGIVEVTTAAPLDERFRFEVQTAGDLRAELFQWATRRGHVLVELSTQRSSLEDIFRELTTEAAA